MNCEEAQILMMKKVDMLLIASMIARMVGMTMAMPSPVVPTRSNSKQIPMSRIGA